MLSSFITSKVSDDDDDDDDDDDNDDTHGSNVSTGLSSHLSTYLPAVDYQGLVQAANPFRSMCGYVGLILMMNLMTNVCM
jgi:hypothetical protein